MGFSPSFEMTIYTLGIQFTYFSAWSHAIAPVHAEVIAWRNSGSCTSHAAKTHGTDVSVLPGFVLICHDYNNSSCPSKNSVFGVCHMA